MTPLNHIETHVIDRLQGTIHDLVLTVARCGDWPVSATLDEYLAAVDRAQREVARTVRLEDRYWRRFRRPIEDNEPATARLITRRAVAQAITDQRSECVRLLTEPAGGVA